MAPTVGIHVAPALVARSHIARFDATLPQLDLAAARGRVLHTFTCSLGLERLGDGA